MDDTDYNISVRHCKYNLKKIFLQFFLQPYYIVKCEGFPPSTPLGHRHLGHIPCHNKMQTVKITSISEASLELSSKGSFKLTAKINGSKLSIEAWISKSLMADCKTQDALIKRLKACKDINLGASVEITESGNSVIKYWITKPAANLKLVASW